MFKKKKKKMKRKLEIIQNKEEEQSNQIFKYLISIIFEPIINELTINDFINLSSISKSFYNSLRLTNNTKTNKNWLIRNELWLILSKNFCNFTQKQFDDLLIYISFPVIYLDSITSLTKLLNLIIIDYQILNIFIHRNNNNIFTIKDKEKFIIKNNFELILKDNIKEILDFFLFLSKAKRFKSSFYEVWYFKDLKTCDQIDIEEINSLSNQKFGNLLFTTSKYYQIRKNLRMNKKIKEKELNVLSNIKFVSSIKNLKIDNFYIKFYIFKNVYSTCKRNLKLIENIEDLINTKYDLRKQFITKPYLNSPLNKIIVQFSKSNNKDDITFQYFQDLNTQFLSNFIHICNLTVTDKGKKIYQEDVNRLNYFKYYISSLLKEHLNNIDKLNSITNKINL